MFLPITCTGYEM
jgi:hypothetical protein